MKPSRWSKVADWVAPARARLSTAGILAAIVGPGLVTALAPITSLEGKQGITALYLAAVVAATTIGGLWAGLIATALSLLGLDYFFVEPINSFSAGDRDPLITGAVASLLAVIFIDRVQRRREAVQRQAERAEEEMASRARRQEALANLGRIALTAAPRERLYGEVVSLVADALDVEFSSLLEVAPGGQEAIIRAGVGWREGTLGAAVSTGPDSLAGYTLSRDEPVVIDDLRGDGRFAGSPILQQHQVVSGVVVPIPSAEGPFGLLSAMSRSRRRFTSDDVQFVRVAATMVGSAVQRRSAQDALQEARDEFQALIEASPDPIVAYDRDGIVTLWNPAAERVFGWSAEEALGRFLPIVPEHMREEFDRLREAVLGGRSFSGFETTRRRKDGSAIEISVSNAPVRDAFGNVRGVVALDTDITERRRAERAIRESEEKLRLALEAAAVGWWDWNVATGEVLWSDNLEPIHGLPPGGFEGTFEGYLEHIHPDDRERFQQAVGRAISEASELDFEFRVIWPDASVHWMQGIGHVTPRRKQQAGPNGRSWARRDRAKAARGGARLSRGGERGALALARLRADVAGGCPAGRPAPCGLLRRRHDRGGAVSASAGRGSCRSRHGAARARPRAALPDRPRAGREPDGTCAANRAGRARLEPLGRAAGGVRTGRGARCRAARSSGSAPPCSCRSRRGAGHPASSRSSRARGVGTRRAICRSPAISPGPPRSPSTTHGSTASGAASPGRSSEACCRRSYR